MAIKNSELIDEENGIFSILDTVHIQLSGPYWWKCEDIDEENCTGSIFRLFDEKESLDIAYIMVVDATNDPSEPDISGLDEDNVEAVDRYLFGEIVSALKQEGREMLEWMSSQLNETDCMKALVTAYKTQDQGKDRQEVHMRINVNGRKWVLISCFDIARKDELAKPIIDIVRGAQITDSESRGLH